MIDAIEKLLCLQERDRQIHRLKDQLSRIPPERRDLENKGNFSQTNLESAKHKSKQIESERKRLELEVDAKKQQIEKYSIQQFQTKKNEEYKALGNEIETCKAAIVQLEDRQLELMEQAETANQAVVRATQEATETKKVIEQQLAGLSEREQKLRRELEDLEKNRPDLAAAVGDDSILDRYERLLRNKGENVIVGVEHGVCGGCHMRLPTQVFLSAKAGQEIITCPNCARILYYTSDMDMAVAD